MTNNFEKSPLQTAKSVNSVMRVSERKLNLVATMIRGKRVEEARNLLQFCEKRIAGDVKKTLESAIANAENNHSMDVDKLIVGEAFVGKRMVMKRMHTRARGRSARVEKFFSSLTIILHENLA